MKFIFNNIWMILSMPANRCAIEYRTMESDLRPSGPLQNDVHTRRERLAIPPGVQSCVGRICPTRHLVSAERKAAWAEAWRPSHLQAERLSEYYGRVTTTARIHIDATFWNFFKFFAFCDVKPVLHPCTARTLLGFWVFTLYTTQWVIAVLKLFLSCFQLIFHTVNLCCPSPLGNQLLMPSSSWKMLESPLTVSLGRY